jgi:PAS domain S-box-containing protein
MAEQKSSKNFPNEDQFRAFMDSSPIFAWAKDAEGRYVYVNKTYESTFGSRMDNWRGKTDLEIWSPESAEQIQRNDIVVLEQQRIVNDVQTLAAAEGGRSYLICKFPFRDESGDPPVGEVGVDISEQKRLEEELRLSEKRFQTLSDLALEGVIIHDREKVVDACTSGERV